MPWFFCQNCGLHFVRLPGKFAQFGDRTCSLVCWGEFCDLSAATIDDGVEAVGADAFVARARQMAETKHACQRYGDAPYTTHLADVVKLLTDCGFGDPRTLATAWLHDVLEDTSATQHEIQFQFGPAVASAVGFCTDAHGKTRKERKQFTHVLRKSSVETWKEGGHLLGMVPGIRVKVADRLANAKASAALWREGKDRGKFEMYQQEYADFRATYFVDGVCNALWRDLDVIFAPG